MLNLEKQENKEQFLKILKILKISVNLVFILVLVANLILIYFSTTSLLGSIRVFVWIFSLFLSSGLFLFSFFSVKFIYKICSLFALFVLSITILTILSFQFNKFMFFNFQDTKLETDKHLIVGYRNENELKKLVQKNKIAGVYITSRNIQGKTKEEIKNFIQDLQNERKKHSEIKLIIMADQEGGIVSHLSPLLTETKSLGQILAENPDSQKEQIENIASIHGRELKEIGINLNLAPVADLESENSAGGYSQISKRAISKNPETAQIVIKTYCNKLWEYEVKCTLKHFPGIGDVSEDTHFKLGVKKGSLEKIKYEASSFTSPKSPHFVMVSHSKIEIIDNQNPTSTSKKAIKFLKEINPDGQVITDDFSMMPISRDIGIKKAYTQSLDAGVDYILISYDKDLAYKLF